MVLRRCSGSRLRSSPLYARQSKATSWSCLQEYRALKSEIPTQRSQVRAKYNPPCVHLCTYIEGRATYLHPITAP